MRVLLLNSRLSDRGGADRWLLGVLKRLQGRIETLAAVGYLDRALPAAELQRAGPWVRVKGLDRSGLGRRGGQGALAGLRATLESFDPQVVHVNDVTDPDLLALVAGTGRGVMTVQDHRVFCPGRGKLNSADQPCQQPAGEACEACFDDPAYGRTMLALTRRRAAAVAGMARVTVLSRYMAEQLTGAGVPRARIQRLPPFVDSIGRGEPPAGEGYHLLAGRLVQHKGVQVALEAASLLREALPLVVAGHGPLAPQVAQAAAGQRVRQVGWAHREAMGALLRGARTLWLPSLWAEPFGIVGLEALWCGVPVIASRVGGVTDWLVPQVNGLLVAPGCARELAAAADRLAADAALARRMGHQGQQMVRRDHDPEQLMLRLLEIYHQLGGPLRSSQ